MPRGALLTSLPTRNSVMRLGTVICPIFVDKQPSFREPKPARARSDAERPAVEARNGELRDDPGGGGSPDLVSSPLCEPEVAVGPDGNDKRLTAGGHRELGEVAGGGDPPD